jgi:hypothetical protein
MKNFKQIRKEISEDVRDMKNYDDRNRKGFEARAFIEIKKGNTSNKFDDDFGFTKAEMVQMDKIITKIKGMHVSSFDGGSSAPASLEFYGEKSSLDKFAKDRNVQNIAKKYKSKVEVYLNK